MAQFPIVEIQIVALAIQVRNGLAAHVELYPNPPVLPADMTTLLDSYQSVQGSVLAARANAETLTAQKLGVLNQIVEQLKKNLKYAETVAGKDDEKLNLLGWSVRKSPTAMTRPGQPRNLIVYPQGESWLELEWMAPAEGDKPSMYKVQRRLRNATAWELIATAFERKISLQDQPRGVEVEYSVLAANKAGDGPMSNTVMVVL